MTRPRSLLGSDLMMQITSTAGAWVFSLPSGRDDDTARQGNFVPRETITVKRPITETVMHERQVTVPTTALRYVDTVELQCVPVQSTRYLHEQQVRKVPVETVRYVEEEKVRKVPVERVRYVEEERTRDVPVEVVRYFEEERARMVPVGDPQAATEIPLATEDATATQSATTHP